MTVRYFASLPVANPDGSRGIALNPIYRPPTPHADYDNVLKNSMSAVLLTADRASSTRRSRRQGANLASPTRC